MEISVTSFSEWKEDCHRLWKKRNAGKAFSVRAIYQMVVKNSEMLV